jgi:hypothetical protein
MVAGEITSPRREFRTMSHQNASGDQLRPPNPLSVVDRRSGLDRRDMQPDAGTNLERRRGPGRRRTDFLRAAEEGEMTAEQMLFVQAIDAFKRVNGKTFPTWTDVLEVVRKLGYRKTMSSELNLGANCEDWTEPADAESGVYRTSDQPDEEAA